MSYFDEAFELVSANPNLITSMDVDAQTTFAVAQIALRANSALYRDMCPEAHDHYEITLFTVSRCGLMLEWASLNLKNNKTLVLRAVQNNGIALQWASDTLRDDPDVIRAALQSQGMAIQWVETSAIIANYSYIQLAVANNGLTLGWLVQNVSNTYADDAPLCLVAVAQNGMSLQYTNFRNNRVYVLTAVRQNGLALQWASAGLRNNIIIAIAAVRQNGSALQWVGDNIRTMNDIVEAAFTQNHNVLLDVFGNDSNLHTTYINHFRSLVAVNPLLKRGLAASIAAFLDS